jgi:hypothetical protein
MRLAGHRPLGGYRPLPPLEIETDHAADETSPGRCAVTRISFSAVRASKLSRDRG